MRSKRKAAGSTIITNSTLHRILNPPDKANTLHNEPKSRVTEELIPAGTAARSGGTAALKTRTCIAIAVQAELLTTSRAHAQPRGEHVDENREAERQGDMSIDMDKLRAGDDEQIRQLYVFAQSLLLPLIRKLMSKSGPRLPLDEEDLLLETFSRIITQREKLPAFEQDQQLLSYCYNVARNTYQAYVRRHTLKELPKASDNITRELDNLKASPDPGTEFALEVRQSITDALSHLSEIDRLIVRMRIEGLTTQQIAEEVSMSERTVIRRYFSAIKKLRRHLDQ
jgi:RNA polymerase sigma factor (sigma-70 family)